MYGCGTCGLNISGIVGCAIAVIVILFILYVLFGNGFGRNNCCC